MSTTLRKVLAVGWALFQSAVVWADCIDDAASHHQVNPYILRAIAVQESSMRSWIVNKNRNGTIDVGLMGTNSVHFNELAKFGIGPNTLTEPCLAAYVGAWMYRKKIHKFGNTWNAVGAYHSETPSEMVKYSNRIRSIVARCVAQGMS